jgi:large subunit ribosomal protein L30
MILVIRISGLVEMPSDANETMFRMHLRKKYSAILLKETEGNKNLLQLIRNFVAYGPIDKATLELLISKRAKSLDKKRVDYKRAAEIIESAGIDKAGIKSYFRLHPPRGGIKSKIHFPKGVLGDNQDKINALVRRML